VSSFGWSYLSRDALRRADRQLAGSGEGVRDEIGFLIVHQRYADYFFPGTSVLHTRLRYALFVPWIYQTAYEDRSTGRPIDILKKAETALAGRLRDARGGGAIGGEIYPKPVSQPPSVSYWNALGIWGLLRRTDGQLPTRAQLAVMLQSGRRRALDDDGQPFDRADLPFAPLPAPPKNWIGAEPLEFDLPPGEAEFLRSRLIDLRPRAPTMQRSLLARLAASKRLSAKDCWAPEVVDLAENDAETLRRAQCAASLAAVGRAVYAALVETLREEEDRLPTPDKHRKNLAMVIDEHGPIASRTRIADLLSDTGALPRPVVEVLQQTIQWLDNGAKDIGALRDAYEQAEWSRKHQRARLSRLDGARCRLDWESDKHADAVPLHYRWNQVSRLLGDLWDAA
jgi:hypothetical protein